MAPTIWQITARRRGSRRRFSPGIWLANSLSFQRESLSETSEQNNIGSLCTNLNELSRELLVNMSQEQPHLDLRSSVTTAEYTTKWDSYCNTTAAQCHRYGLNALMHLWIVNASIIFHLRNQNYHKYYIIMISQKSVFFFWFFWFMQPMQNADELHSHLRF